VKISTTRASSSHSTSTAPAQKNTQFFHGTTNTLEIIQQNHGDELKLKIKPRRRRTSNQQQVQEEKDKSQEPNQEEKASKEQAITTSKQLQLITIS
jgi:hypothetical protein